MNSLGLVENNLALHERKVAAMADAANVFGLPAPEVCRTWPRDKRQELATHLLIYGLSIKSTADLLGANVNTIYEWFSADTEEMNRLMRHALSADASRTVPKAWRALKKLLKSENQETVRKASLDILRAAGSGIDGNTGGGPGVTINVKGDNTKLTILSVSDIEAEMRRLAGELDPTAVKLVDAEIVGDGTARAAGAATAQDKGREAPALPGPSGGVPAEEARPAP